VLSSKLSRLMLILILLSLNLVSVAQDYSISVKAIYSSYRMDELKTFQDELHQDALDLLELPFVISDDFPGHIGYEFDAGLYLPTFHLSFGLGYRNTGGRISYADFSGRFDTDNLLNVLEVRGGIGTRIDPQKKAQFVFKLITGIAFTSHEVSTSLELIGQVPQNDLVKFTSQNIILGFNGQMRFKLFDQFFLSTPLGYELHIPGNLRLSTDKEAFLVNDDDDNVRANWSGFRVGLGLGIIF